MHLSTLPSLASAEKVTASCVASEEVIESEIGFYSAQAMEICVGGEAESRAKLRANGDEEKEKEKMRVQRSETKEEMISVVLHKMIHAARRTVVMQDACVAVRCLRPHRVYRTPAVWEVTSRHQAAGEMNLSARAVWGERGLGRSKEEDAS